MQVYEYKYLDNIKHYRKLGREKEGVNYIRNNIIQINYTIF